jgi:hypothetical protein
MIDQKNQQGTQARQVGAQFNAQNGFPVDNFTYNLMAAFVSKCEAIEAYRKYAKDNNGQFFQNQIKHEWDEAHQLFQQLQQHICH